MLIHGCDDAPLVAGEELLSHPGSWAAYLLWMCESDDEGAEPGAEWFGADEADVDAVHGTLLNAELRPVFRVPFGGGHTAVVVSRNLPDDGGAEYFVTHPDRRRHRHLATVDGRQAGPGSPGRS
ncbi:hypothetical protein AB0442_21200 [Kitasatospora sp. NPDC085895]|uniref:hypothetical protein n=1 Tax=Kitasatospora sp. NPDC085895 TaxID=3155057 RepID=UPI00344F21D6